MKRMLTSRFFPIFPFFLSFVSIIPNLAQADCAPSGPDVCIKMKLVSAEMKNFPPYFSRNPQKDRRDLCDVRLQELESKKEWQLKTEVCPKFKDFEYISFRIACNDMPLGPVVADDLEIWDKDECELNPAANKARVKKILDEIKPGVTFGSIKKHGFRIVGSRHDSKNSERMKVYILHSFPGVSLDVRMTHCVYGRDPGCFPYNPDNFKVEEVKELRDEFVSARECQIWGGTLGPAEELRKKGTYLSGSFFVPAGCEISSWRKLLNAF